MEPQKPRRVDDFLALQLPAQPCWVEPSIVLKGSYVSISGPAAIGKTFMMLEAADHLARGAPLFGMFSVPVPARVLLIEQEVGIYGMQKRLRVKYQDRAPSGFWVLTKDPDLSIDDPGGFDRLCRHVEVVDPGILILDPITRFMTHGDESDNAAVSRCFRNLDRLIVARPEMSILFSHHFGKDPQKPEDDWDDLSMDRARGASKWRDVPDLRITARTIRMVDGRPAAWKTRWTPRHAAEREIILTMGNDFSIVGVNKEGGKK